MDLVVHVNLPYVTIVRPGAGGVARPVQCALHMIHEEAPHVMAQVVVMDIKTLAGTPGQVKVVNVDAHFGHIGVDRSDVIRNLSAMVQDEGYIGIIGGYMAGGVLDQSLLTFHSSRTGCLAMSRYDGAALHGDVAYVYGTSPDQVESKIGKSFGDACHSAAHDMVIVVGTRSLAVPSVASQHAAASAAGPFVSGGAGRGGEGE